MRTLELGRFRTRVATAPNDLRAVQSLRHLAFRGRAGRDHDDIDQRCLHVLVEPASGGAPVACFRLMRFGEGVPVAAGYAARLYDLSRLSALPGAKMEIGRFCIRPGLADPDILRLAWGMLAAEIDRTGTRMIFGCASFPGTDPAPHADSFALLRRTYLAPDEWRPGPRSAPVIRFDAPDRIDTRAALAGLPPLLRSYVAMGGRVSGHAVVDHDLGTLHVFVGLDVTKVPESRARTLLGIARRARPLPSAP